MTKSEAEIAHLHVSQENAPRVETDSRTQKNCKSSPRPRTRKIGVEIQACINAWVHVHDFIAAYVYHWTQSRIREVYKKLATDEEQQLKLDEG